MSVSARAVSNFAIGWTSLAVGAATGLVIGLWSFGGPIPVPDWIGSYDSLSRRLLRLGHIAFFGLGILNIMLARHLSRARIPATTARLGLGAMNFGNIVLPLALMAAALFEPLKYLMTLPALAITVALIIGARAAIAEAKGDRA